MDEAGKWFSSVSMIILGCFLIILSIIIGILDMIAIISVGVALCSLGVFIYYLRHVSIKSQSRVKKAKVTRVIREVPKPKPKPKEIEEEKPIELEILCHSCRFYDEYNIKQKCRFLADKDRMSMINAGMECIEYKIKLSLLDED